VHYSLDFTVTSPIITQLIQSGHCSWVGTVKDGSLTNVNIGYAGPESVGAHGWCKLVSKEADITA